MSESKSRIAFWGVIVVVVLGLFAWLNRPAEELDKTPKKVEQAAPAKPQGLPVKALPVLVGDLVEDISAVGNIVANESVRVRTEISGRLVELNFNEGQSIKKGQLLVALDDAVHRAQAAAISAELRTEQQKYLRSKELYQQNFISKEAVSYTHLRAHET